MLLFICRHVSDCGHAGLVQLRTWEAYKELKRKIEGFQQKLPLFASLCKPSIRDRHWTLIQECTGAHLRPFDADFCLRHLLSIDVSSTLMDVEEVADGAEKELAIETKLVEMEDKWKNERFRFVEWRGRGVPILVGIPLVLEDLEEVLLQMLTHVHINDHSHTHVRALTRLERKALLWRRETLLTLTHWRITL